MRTVLLSVALAGIVAACGREEQPGPGAAVEQAQQAERAAGQTRPLSDTSLTQIVRAALESESSLDARRIDVENREGVIALHGQVDSEEQKEKAGRIVGSVGGVKSVENRLTVSPSASVGATTGAPVELPK